MNSKLIKTADEIASMKAGGSIHHAIVEELVKATLPGTTTQHLDDIAVKLMRQYGVHGVFKGYHGYPKSICTSINEQVVHGIPSSQVTIKEGDLVKIDVGIKYKGLILDGGRAIQVGIVASETALIAETAEEALALAIATMADGISVAAVARKVQRFIESRGYSVVRQLTGHGVGSSMHMPPEMPNYYRPRDEKVILKKGMTIAVEPMINAGTYELEELDDHWTIVTKDRRLSAWCEHTVLVGKSHGIILTQ